jgi:hypothetical protein
MRDRRFVAVHCGGLLSIEHHRQLASWAADCAEHVLPIFTSRCPDDRPRRAVEAARAWAKGRVSVGEARKAALEAHSAARAAVDDAAISVARATGHAVATAHMADHSLGAAEYALKAGQATDIASATERIWQDEHLPEDIRELVLSARREREAQSSQMLPRLRWEGMARGRKGSHFAANGSRHRIHN